ncbi:MAG: hypothetical protein KJ964_10635 [Verrucomicrobia bacterium]|nr:hypothetical protein [Verrucomicrobiota bacterium]MBU1734371.1 hypothetical protein [Verrucomicrobiota bacterium]MBU1856718.1 hypothetical protein [Verrucomicrobiota bacterium]
MSTQHGKSIHNAAINISSLRRNADFKKSMVVGVKLLFLILILSQNSLATVSLPVATDYSKWQPYESAEPKSVITIESVEIPVPEPAPAAVQSPAKPRQPPNKWLVLKEKLFFFGLQKCKPAPPQVRPVESAPQPPIRKTVMHVKTPGNKTLEGVRTDLTVEPQNRYLISCKIMGEGRVMLSVLRGVWVYGPQRQLSADWQDFELEFYTGTAAFSATLLVSSAKPQEGSLNILDFKIEQIKAPEMPDVEVAPIRFEAERYLDEGTAISPVKDKNAGGGAYMEGGSYYCLAQNVPLPRTGRPFYIYLRAMANNAGMKSMDLVYRKEIIETFARVAIPAAGKWAWVRTGPLSYKIGESFQVRAGGAERNAAARLDSIIISTRGDLSEIELDKVIPGR